MTENKNKATIAWLVMLVSALLVGLGISIAALVEANAKLDKYDAIFEMACDYSANKTYCNKGVNAMKNMDIKDIKDIQELVR